MKLSLKREIVEALLCAASPMTYKYAVTNYAVTLVNAVDAFRDMGDPERERISGPAAELRRKAMIDLGLCNIASGDESPYAETALEAAYRLIESSPSWRREWFHRPRRKR